MPRRGYLFAVLAVGALSGCGGETEIIGPEGGSPAESAQTYSLTRYTYEQYGFSISFPVGWRVEESPNLIQAFTPEYRQVGDFIENVNAIPFTLSNPLTEEELDEMFRQIAELARAGDAPYMSAFQENETGKVVIDNHIVRWRLASYKIGTVPIAGLAYYFADSQRLYTLTCSAKPERFHAYRSLFEDIAQSFRFE